jgi:hypothetical protein
MLSLRSAQITALTEPRLADFEDRMRSHVGRCFMATTRTMSDQAIREVIRYGAERAQLHDICSERDVCKYINLMFVFGRDFDRDPRLPWAHEILAGARVHRDLSTIELLYQAALVHETQARGLDGGDP